MEALTQRGLLVFLVKVAWEGAWRVAPEWTGLQVNMVHQKMLMMKCCDQVMEG